MKQTIRLSGVHMLVVVFSVFSLVACARERKTEKTVNSKSVLYSSLAGSWYPSDKETLRKELQGYLDNAKKVKVDHLLALLVPHAGYAYSGQTAAYGMKLLEGKKYKRVVILGPSHHVRMINMVSVPSSTHYGTPLGEVPVDVDAVEKLKNLPFVVSYQWVHVPEHSVQIEVPWLQMVLKDFKIVPIVVGQLDQKTAEKIGGALLPLMDKETLLVISSDFTHQGPRYGYTPFRTHVGENIKKLDMGAFENIRKVDLTGFYKYVGKTGITICGRCPIGILLAMLPKDAKVELLKYDTSATATGGDYTNSVSYVCASFGGTWPTAYQQPYSLGQSTEGKDKATLSAEDKKNLLKMARKTVEYYFEKRKKPTAKDLGIAVTPGMEQIMGAFVTLHENGRLRGCIGEIIPTRELYKAVIDRALSAAFGDPRFRPLSKDELKKVDFEISALTPSKPVKSYKDIIIGKHGMTVSKSGRSAVFLPQVATEQGWDLATTLTYLSRKAGLPGDAWKEGATFTVFEAIVFGEKDQKKEIKKP